LAHWFGEEVSNVPLSGDVSKLDAVVGDKIANKVETEIHVLCPEAVLAHLTEGKVDGASVINEDRVGSFLRTGEDFLREIADPNNFLACV
jgi:hypothetical protein